MAANALGEEKSPAPSRGLSPARIAVIAALAVGVIALGVVLFGGGSEYQYDLIFQNAGQLVPENQVMVGGSPVGSVESIELTENNLASVKVSVSQQLHQGTTAVIRATSLSGVANHYVSISPGPNSNPPLEEGATLGLASTTTPVDIDQLFNTFPPSVRRGLSEFIRGNAAIYAGVGHQANQAYKYFGPALNRTDAFAHALNADQNLFTRFIVSSSKLATAVSERSNQLSSAISNASTAFGAIAGQNVSLDQALQEFPAVLRQSNTTFVNLRAAIGDLEPLVDTAKPATKNLAPFLAELRPVVNEAVPVFKNLRLTVQRSPARPTTRPNSSPRFPTSSRAPQRHSPTPRKRSPPSSRPSTSPVPTRRTSSTGSASSASPPATTTATATTCGRHWPIRTSSTTTAAAANSNRSPRNSSSKPSARRPASTGAARAAPPSPLPTTPTPSSTRPGPAPASPQSECKPSDEPPGP